MNSNGFSAGADGGLVIKKDEDAQEISEYEDMVKSLSIEEFDKLVGNYDINKSFEAAKVAIRKKYVSKYFVEWGHSTYLDFLTDSVNTDREIDSDMSDWVNSKIKTINLNLTKGSYPRLESLWYMLFEIQPREKTGYTCTVFSLKKTGSDKPTNYAYMYSLVSGQRTDKKDRPSTVSHKYFCTGPNLISADGEYRNRFTNMSTIEHVKLYHADMWDEVEEYLSNRPKVKFTQNYYLSHNMEENHVNDFKDDVDAHRYAMQLYIIAWLSQGFISYFKLQNKHVDSTYNRNMFDPSDNKFIAHLIEIYGVDKLKLFYWESGYISGPITHKQRAPEFRYNPTLGQKIIPLGDEDSKYVGNLKFAPWREFYISERVSDLVINLVCPGVPVTHDWFYISGVDKNLFDNPKLYERMEISDEAKEVVHKLKKARSSVYYKMDLKSEKMDRLSKEFGLKEEELIVSDKGIVVISEYVGRTVNDIAESLKSDEYNKSVGSMFSKPDEFSKYMFDVTYALLCMNSRIGIIHGDLHLNNTTIHHMFKSYIHGDSRTIKKNKFVLYIMEKDVFVFKDTGKIGTVIDFSRGFIVPPEEERELKESQSNRILDYYKQLFPEFTKSFGEKLKIKLAEDFEHVYKIFSAIDMYIHTDRLIKFTEKYALLQTHKKVTELIVKINNITRYYLKDVMEKIVTKDMDIGSIKYPNYDILLRCFGDHILTPAQMEDTTMEIDDIFFYKNKLRYSIAHYDKLPPRIKFVRLKKPGNAAFVDMPYAHIKREQLQIYYNNRDRQKSNT
jgi:hypothetical protein